MSIRTFVFCDGCNPHAIRIDSKQGERRIKDRHRWYEGYLTDALELGWEVDNHKNILCPSCVNNGITSLLLQVPLEVNEFKINV